MLLVGIRNYQLQHSHYECSGHYLPGFKRYPPSPSVLNDQNHLFKFSFQCQAWPSSDLLNRRFYGSVLTYILPALIRSNHTSGGKFRKEKKIGTKITIYLAKCRYYTKLVINGAENVQGEVFCQIGFLEIPRLCHFVLCSETTLVLAVSYTIFWTETVCNACATSPVLPTAQAILVLLLFRWKRSWMDLEGMNNPEILRARCKMNFALRISELYKDEYILNPFPDFQYNTLGQPGFQQSERSTSSHNSKSFHCTQCPFLSATRTYQQA